MIRAATRQIGGSALARAALSGDLPAWYGPRVSGVSAWSSAARAVSDDFGERDWHSALLPAFGASGPAAARLVRAAMPGGVVVTGGQQPGLFGGPLYVLHKAMTLLEFADALERTTGRAVAPIFWAATDDADYAEANHVSVVRHGKLETLTMPEPPHKGRSMSATALGNVESQFERLREASGSGPDAQVLEVVHAAYDIGATVGSAYVDTLRKLLEPLGVAVLDASHPAVRRASHGVIVNALLQSERIAGALRERTRAIADAGFHPQVADVPNLSLVFETLSDGTRRRIPIRSARSASESGNADALGPNVLLRPIVERQILPTVTYVGGPGEVAYFAQVSAVADALGIAAPRISPRWSGVLLERHIEEMLGALHATPDDLVDPHALETRVARDAVSAGVKSAVSDLRAALAKSAERMQLDSQTSDALRRSVGTMRAGVEYRLARLERRYAAAMKQTGSNALRDLAHVRASLYPNGSPQERVLSFIPFLARYGSAAIDAIRAQARIHVAGLIQGG